MENLHNLDLEVLMDMLSKQADKYSQMLNEGGGDQEFERCRKNLEAIQKEISERKQGMEQSSAHSSDSIDITV